MAVLTRNEIIKAIDNGDVKIEPIDLGNIGPASVPIVLAKVAELGKLNRGDRVALMGIGSGLNCCMAEVVW